MSHAARLYFETNSSSASFPCPVQLPDKSSTSPPPPFLSSTASSSLTQLPQLFCRQIPQQHLWCLRTTREVFGAVFSQCSLQAGLEAWSKHLIFGPGSDSQLSSPMHTPARNALRRAADPTGAQFLLAFSHSPAVPGYFSLQSIHGTQETPLNYDGRDARGETAAR